MKLSILDAPEWHDLEPTATYHRREYRFVPGGPDGRTGTLTIRLAKGKRAGSAWEEDSYAVGEEQALPDGERRADGTPAVPPRGGRVFGLTNETDPDAAEIYEVFVAATGGQHDRCTCTAGQCKLPCKHRAALRDLIEREEADLPFAEEVVESQPEAEVVAVESWRLVWRNGFAPVLATRGLEALAGALRTDDARIIQGGLTTPPPFMCVRDWPVESCSGLCFCGWQGLGLTTVGEVEEFFAKVCFEADQRLGEPAACRWFLNWFDDTPRAEMRRELLAEIERELGGREEDCYE